MKFNNYEQYKAIKKKMELKISKHYPTIKNQTGIYMFCRVVAYIGKSSERDGILGRCASHCIDHKQHIDNSIHNRKLTCDGGQWHILPLTYCHSSQVDEMERKFIAKYLSKGYELYNIESGGSTGKSDITERKERGGYNKGKGLGYKKCKEEIKNYFDKYLDYSIKGNPTKIKERKLAEFSEFLADKSDNKESGNE